MNIPAENTKANENIIVFGGTGSGKTMSVVVPTLVGMNESSLIGVFTKKGLVKKAVPYFEKKGYKVYVMDFSDPEECILPDLLLNVRSDSDIEEIASSIAHVNDAYMTATKFDPYWLDASKGLMIAILYYTFMTAEKPTMKKVIELFYKIRIIPDGKGFSTNIDYIFDWLDQEMPDSVMAKKMLSFRQLNFDTATCIYDDLEKSIQNMFPASVQNAMSNEYINFESIAVDKTAVFIITSPVRVSQYSYANLLFDIIIRSLMEYSEMCDDNRLPLNVKLIFDDFSCGFPIRNFEKLISTFRACGISAIMLCQSLSQLHATFGKDKATVILDNSSSLVYLPGGGISRVTTSYMAYIAGMEKSKILSMAIGDVLIVQSGQAYISKRHDVLNDPACMELLNTRSCEKTSQKKPKKSKTNSEFIKLLRNQVILNAIN